MTDTSTISLVVSLRLVESSLLLLSFAVLFGTTSSPMSLVVSLRLVLSSSDDIPSALSVGYHRSSPRRLCGKRNVDEFSNVELVGPSKFSAANRGIKEGESTYDPRSCCRPVDRLFKRKLQTIERYPTSQIFLIDCTKYGELSQSETRRKRCSSQRQIKPAL